MDNSNKNTGIVPEENAKGLTPFERKVLILNFEQKLLYCEDEGDRRIIRRNIEILDDGIELFYDEVLGLSDLTISPSRSELVYQILDMFLWLKASIDALSEDEKAIWTPEELRRINFRSVFQGFDNREEEIDLLIFCRFVFKYGGYDPLLEDFNSTFGREGGSQASMLNGYLKALDVFKVEHKAAEATNEDRLLSARQIARVCRVDGY